MQNYTCNNVLIVNEGLIKVKEKLMWGNGSIR